MRTTTVRTDVEAYRIAAAELPLSVAIARGGAGGDVVVVGGAGRWWTAASDAIDRGAAAIVIAQPAGTPVEHIDALADVAAGIPVLLERALLRPDVTEAMVDGLSGLAAPAALIVECHAPASAFRTALREAIGWARVVAGAPLIRRSGEWVDDSVLALFETAEGLAVSLVAATQASAPPLGRVRITTIAETRVEVDVDLLTVVTITDDAGRRIAPVRFESPERVALRRAIETMRAGEGPVDLADLRHDAALAEALLSVQRT